MALLTRYAVLLQGINVGRAKRIAMADLRRLLAEAGFAGVATLLNSGNVVLDSTLPAAEVGATVEEVVREGLGVRSAAVVRTVEEIRAVVALDPLGDVAHDGSRYVVGFMASAPGPSLEELLNGVDAGEDRYAVHGLELYVWCPNGQTDSPLMTALGKAKGGPATTVRNWNTVRRVDASMRR